MKPWENYSSIQGSEAGPWAKYGGETAGSGGGGESEPEKESTLMSRFLDRASAIDAPTFGGQAAGGSPLAESVAGAPEKAVRILGGAAGTLGDVAFTGLKNIGQAIIPKQAEEAIGSGVERATSAIAKRIPEPVKHIAGQAIEDERLGPTLEAGLNLAGALPAGKALTSPIAKALGKQTLDIASIPQAKAGALLEKGGENLLKSEMKIKDVTARKAGKTVDEGVAKIMTDIGKYDISSPKGFKGMIDKVDDEITASNEKADSFLKAAKELNPDAKISLDAKMARLKEDIIDGRIDDIPIEDKDRALAFIDNLTDSYKTHFGKNIEEPASLTLDEANRARQLLSKGVFKKGAPNINQDPLKDLIKEKLALSFRDAVAEYAPEQAAANREIRDLLNVKRAIMEAKKRTGNLNQMGLGDWLTLGGATGGIALGAGTGPGGVAAGMAALGAKKLASQGRGAGALIKTGKVLQSETGRKVGGGLGILGTMQLGSRDK